MKFFISKYKWAFMAILAISLSSAPFVASAMVTSVECDSSDALTRLDELEGSGGALAAVKDSECRQMIRQCAGKCKENPPKTCYADWAKNSAPGCKAGYGSSEKPEGGFSKTCKAGNGDTLHIVCCCAKDEVVRIDNTSDTGIAMIA